MNLEVRAIGVEERYIEPKIRVGIRINMIQAWQVIYHATGALKINEKIIDKSGYLAKIDQYLYTTLQKRENIPSLDIEFDFNISKKALNEIDLYRRKESNKKKCVEFTIEVHLDIIESNIVISHIREIRFGPYNNSYKPDQLPSISKGVQELLAVHKSEPMDVSALYYVQGDNYIPPRNDMNILSANNNDRSLLKLSHLDLTVNHIVSSLDWLMDFAPKLGAGEYEIIEIPKLKADSSNNKFKKSLDNLETAKKKLYELEIGSAQAALRNSVKSFNEALIDLGYVKTNKDGMNEPDYTKIFKNNNISQLADSLQSKLYGAASRGPEATAPHAASETLIEGYEVESMISMVYFLYKMVFERLKEDEGLRGGLD